MAIRSALYYWLECDEPGCGAISTESSEHTAWSDLSGAIEQAEGADWQIARGGKQFCDAHTKDEEQDSE